MLRRSSSDDAAAARRCRRGRCACLTPRIDGSTKPAGVGGVDHRAPRARRLDLELERLPPHVRHHVQTGPFARCEVERDRTRLVRRVGRPVDAEPLDPIAPPVVRRRTARRGRAGRRAAARRTARDRRTRPGASQSIHDVSLSWLYGLLLPCWVRANSSPATNIGTPWLSISRHMALRSWRRRSAITVSGTPSSPSQPQFHDRLSSLPVGVVPSVGLVVLAVVGDQVVHRESVVGGEEVHRPHRMIEHVRAALQPLHHRRHQSRLAAQEAADVVAEPVVPLHPSVVGEAARRAR